MKIRVKFTKTGALKYIGHLDIMRFFQKLNRRADIPIAYSEGFSPHQILSFSPPLSLGMESIAEYADITVTEKISSAEAIKRMNAASVPDISILSFKELPDKALNAMAGICAADYDIYFDDSTSFECISQNVDNLLKKDEIIITKESKKGQKEVNIKPLIYKVQTDNENCVLSLCLAAGSNDNLKPQLVTQYLYQELNLNYNPLQLRFVRTEQYTLLSDRFVSLDDIGTNIE